MGIAVYDYTRSVTELDTAIPRNSYGEGTKTARVRAMAEGGEEAGDVEITISEKAYTAEEIQELFQRSIRWLDAKILGENESPDRIEKNMELVTEIKGEPIDVSWELDRYDVMNVYGEINEGSLEKEGTPVKLSAVLTYRERKEDQALYECVVMVYPETLNEKEKFLQRLNEEIRKNDEETRTKPVFMLPGKIGGKEVHFYPVMETRGYVLMIMAALILCLVHALDRKNEEKETEKRRRQMRLDYPEIVSKLTLLLGAGMTVKRAWKRIAEDYGKKAGAQKRYAYEEMLYTCREMESGVMESESYERFGRRCGLQEYIKLGALLSQNLRKGTKGLRELLRIEAVQAFEERKARAKRLGEEAGTKLLMPMFLMLLVVLVIVIVPAFLSIQL